jgi:hypothetical protein
MTPSSKIPRPSWPALATAAVLAAVAATAPSEAAAVTDPAGDFLPTYTGPKNGDLDVLSAEALLSGSNVILTATLNGNIGTTPGEVYVFGVNRGAGQPLLTFGAPSVGAGVNFDAVAVLTPGGASFVNLILPTAQGPIALNDVTFSGSKFRAVVPLADLPTNGFAPSQYLYNLWPRSGLGVNTQISDFAPNASSFLASVPEPGAWALLIAGFALTGAVLRRRRWALPA